MDAKRTSVLIVDDEFATRNGVMSSLHEWSGGELDLQTAENGIEALELAKQRPFQLLITDIRMPGISGIELLERLRAARIDIPSILLTGYAEFEYAQRAVQLGALNYLLKPIERHGLIAAVQEALGTGASGKTGEAQNLDWPFGWPKVRNDSIRKALLYIQGEWSRPTLSIKDLAEHIHLNASYVSVLFKEETKLTFTEFVTQLRLRKAKELLRSTDRKIYEIAEEVGFANSKYFVQVFREAERMTPREYRQTQGG